MEAPAAHGIMEGFVPDMTSLFHAIDTLYKLHNPAFLARFLKAEGLFHVINFFRGEYTMKECSFDVELMDVPTKGSDEVKNETERF
jgi:hypothetical protein